MGESRPAADERKGGEGGSDERGEMTHEAVLLRFCIAYGGNTRRMSFPLVAMSDFSARRV
jgi:hypothetical protein